MSVRVVGIQQQRSLIPLLGRLTGTTERIVFGVIGFVGLSALWELGANSGLYRRSLLSSPSAIWSAASADFGSGAMWPHITTSLSEFALGYVVALAVGIPLGFGIGLFRRVDFFASVLLSGIYSTPKVALVPLIIIVAGIGLQAKVIVVFLLAVFAIVVSTVAGVRSVSEKHLDITRSFGASPLLTFRAVVLPSTFPFILSGLRIAAGRALVGVVTAELLAANEGVGFYISFYGTFLDTSRVMLGVILLGTFGIVSGELIRALEHRFERWRPDIHDR
jgi:NitT/TauT family transport system permease protein